ncbi:MAG TPA: XTP/dITP diphosphatase [Hadesarchaea archaeon]|nr:XTP/dITP diphosphatase [Hadesarchaea archaeon]
MALIFVTGNHHKFKEASEIAIQHGIEIEHRNIPYVEIQADKLEDVIRLGIQQACALLNGPCFAEDSGLFIQAFKGFPGPYSNFVFRTLGNDGILKLMVDETNRRAEFKSAVGYCEPGLKPKVFTGGVEGNITLEARGTLGFGFDPIFVPTGEDGRTFAEMPAGEKNKLSHRARAIEAFFRWFKQRKTVDR